MNGRFMTEFLVATENIRAALKPGLARDLELYRQGMKDGVCRYAWWKDGIQKVGSCGTTLAAALAQIDKEES